MSTRVLGLVWLRTEAPRYSHSASPLTIDRGEGGYAHDEESKRYLNSPRSLLRCGNVGDGRLELKAAAFAAHCATAR